MKKRVRRANWAMAAGAGVMLVWGVSGTCASLLAQQAPPTVEREPVRIPVSPETLSSSGRIRAARPMPAEGAGSVERMPMRMAGQGAQPPTEVAPARLEATLYEVQVPVARMLELELPLLQSKAGKAQDLAEALGKVGETKVLYQIDQPVNLYGESITMGTQEPIVSGTRRTDSGAAINTVTYQDLGLVLSLSAKPQGADAPRKDFPVQLNLELAVLSESGVEIGPSSKAARTRKLQLGHSETPRFGTPVVMVSINGQPGSDASLPTAYVVRYVFHAVEP